MSNDVDFIELIMEILFDGVMSVSLEEELDDDFL